MLADAEPDRAAETCRAGADVVDDLLQLLRRFAPGEVYIDMLGGDLACDLRRSAEPDRCMRLLHERELQLATLDRKIAAFPCHRLAHRQVAEDVEKLGRLLIAFAMPGKIPSFSNSSVLPPVTTLSSRRPLLTRSSATA